MFSCLIVPILLAIQLQGKLELVTGATASLVELQLFDSYDKPVCMLDNDSATIGSYPIENGFRIHVRIITVSAHAPHPHMYP